MRRDSRDMEKEEGKRKRITIWVFSLNVFWNWDLGFGILEIRTLRVAMLRGKEGSRVLLFLFLLSDS